MTQALLAAVVISCVLVLILPTLVKLRPPTLVEPPTRSRKRPPVRVNGERYENAEDARKAARELLVQLGNLPNGTDQWDALARHVERLIEAADRSERAQRNGH